MAKHKTITQLPAAPAPRLAAQLLVAVGELLAVGACVVGIVTVAGWLIAGDGVGNKAVRMPSSLREIVYWCRMDRRGGDWCERESRPPARRHYAREDY